MIRALVGIFLFLSASFFLPIGENIHAKDQNKWPCYWVEGRMTAYNGNPTFRIWPQGTHRLLGVVSRNWEERKEGGAEQSDDLERLPASLRALNPKFGREIWGRFHFCPKAPERKGWMRFGHITDANELTVRDYN